MDHFFLQFPKKPVLMIVNYSSLTHTIVARRRCSINVSIFFGNEMKISTTRRWWNFSNEVVHKKKDSWLCLLTSNNRSKAWLYFSSLCAISRDQYLNRQNTKFAFCNLARSLLIFHHQNPIRERGTNWPVKLTSYIHDESKNEIRSGGVRFRSSAKHVHRHHLNKTTSELAWDYRSIE